MLGKRIWARLVAWLPTAEAHCDTEDGPAVQDGRRALASGNLNYALKWIPADGENELRALFDRVMRVRPLDGDAAALAERLFLETLVRLHRMGEGVGFTGIQPSGTPIDPVVAAADRALAEGSDDNLLALVPPMRRDDLHQRFEAALAKRDFPVDDVTAGRDYIAAYVSFFKFAEGEDHEHAGHTGQPGAESSHHAHAADDPHGAHAHHQTTVPTQAM